MKKQKLKVEVEVWGIEVESTHNYSDGKESGWYKFEYTIRVNGGKKKCGEIGGSWSNQTRRHFRAVLGRGEATRKVISRHFE